MVTIIQARAKRLVFSGVTLQCFCSTAEREDCAATVKQQLPRIFGEDLRSDALRDYTSLAASAKVVANELLQLGISNDRREIRTINNGTSFRRHIDIT